jgi:hypothetical protein
MGRNAWHGMMAGILALLAVPLPVLGADTEKRDFAIFVDGKEAGQTRMTITQNDDGSTLMQANANVKVQQAIFTYTFSIQATELWKDGRLFSLKANTNDNGKKTDVQAAADGDRLRLTINGQQRMGNAAWASSYWKLADARFHNKQLPILEGDTGKEFVGQLQFIGMEQITIANQPHKCYHFRVTGGPYPIDLWFDVYHRLVRQEFVEANHRTIIQLTRVGR